MPKIEIDISKQLYDRLTLEAGLQGKWKYTVVAKALDEWLTAREYSRTMHGKQLIDRRCDRAKP
jgi:hypothetical protein